MMPWTHIDTSWVPSGSSGLIDTNMLVGEKTKPPTPKSPPQTKLPSLDSIAANYWKEVCEHVSSG